MPPNAGSWDYPGSVQLHHLPAAVAGFRPDLPPVPAAEDLPLPEGGATAYSFQLPEIEVTMEADSWIGVVFIATDNLGRTSTNGEFFTLQDDMLIFTDDTDPIWEAIRTAQDSE